MLAEVLQFQRDTTSTNTKEGVPAATVSGEALGRPAALDEDKAADVVDAYFKGAAVKALALQCGIAPKTPAECSTRPVPATAATTWRNSMAWPPASRARSRCPSPRSRT
ncbi:hypothetical protein ACWGLF_39545 [Streptomyces puniciscabiei]